MPTLSDKQLDIVNLPDNRKVFLEGKAGSGKTSTAVARYINMVQQGIPAEKILILVPQRVLGQPFNLSTLVNYFPAGGVSEILTMGGLAQRLISLFWPMIYRSSGFTGPSRSPIYLTLETSQYFLARLVNPLLDKGYFEGININRNRLLSQIIDNLNKSAFVGFDHKDIAKLLKSAWNGEERRNLVFDQAQDCVELFRDFCLKNNMLDYSLQMDTFQKNLWPTLLCRKYLTDRYRHLFFENIEEDVPVTIDIIREWLPDFDSALLVFDQNAGYRSFLGADTQLAYSIKSLCDDSFSLTESYISPPQVQQFHLAISDIISKKDSKAIQPEVKNAFTFVHNMYFTQMVDWVSDKIRNLIVDYGVEPEDIVVLSPFLSDSLRFSIVTRLTKLDIPVRTSRPSRSLSAEPAARCLLTLAKLAHTSWILPPDPTDVRNALMLSISDLDLIRADLLTKITYHETKPEQIFTSFDNINPKMQERISFLIGERFEKIRQWLVQYNETPDLDLDIFFSKLFGELLSQPGYGYHDNLDSSALIARVIDSAKKFRAVKLFEKTSISESGKEYIQMVETGVIAAQFLEKSDEMAVPSVFVAPAYTYLMQNKPARYQFWLDIGSPGWSERLSQPLTHPYVLSRSWNTSDKWTDTEEIKYNQQNLLRLTEGLLTRCKEHVYLCSTGINEQGYDQQGPLLKCLQVLVRKLAMMKETRV